MTFEWLREWLYAIMPTTSERIVRELMISNESPNDDSSSSGPVDNSIGPIEQDSQVKDNRWPELIKKYGPNPTAPYPPGQIEVFDLLLTFTSPILTSYRKRVGEFSGAVVTTHEAPQPYSLCLRLTGTVENAYYAIQAYNAALDTTTIPDRKVWVILTLKGPKLAATAQSFKEEMSHKLSEDGFKPVDQLHVTVGLVDPKPHADHHKLYQLVETLVNGLNNAHMSKELVGNFNQFHICQPRRIALAPKNDKDPISIVTRSFRKALEDYGFRLGNYERPHMTIFHSQTVLFSQRFSSNTLKMLDGMVDFGPLMIRSVIISDSVQTLSGIEYIPLAEFPVK